MLPVLVSWVATPLGKAAAAAAVVVLLVGGWFSWLHMHDAGVRQQDSAKVQIETSRQEARDAVAGAHSVEDAAQEDSRRAAALTQGLLEVGDGTSLDDPALRRALERLQAAP